MPDIIVHGGSAPILLGDGYALVVPGLKGVARIHTARVNGSRGLELNTPAFDKALADAQMREAKTIELEVKTAVFPPSQQPLRGPGIENAFELRVPDQGAQYGQVVLSIDEAGAMQWHFPIDTALQVQPSSVRGANAFKVFRIPRIIATRPPANLDIQKRGLLGIIGKKLLKVFIYPLADALLGPVIEKGVTHWEEKKRSHRVRNFLPDLDTTLTTADWTRLATGRALLFVHGTFSTAQAGFGDLPLDTRNELATRYGGRVFAFEHPTLSVSPTDNAKWFFSQMPDGLHLDLDIVCHSRGGLVSRCLAGKPALWGEATAQLKVKRLVLAGVPNMGTQLVNPDHMVAYLDRMTTCLDMFPDNSISDILEGVLTVVKVIGHAGLVALDGLAAMKPGNPFLGKLDETSIPDSTVFGIGSDFEPKDFGLAAAFCRAADSMADRIFDDVPNDLVVPSTGMNAWGGHQQILDTNYLSFAPAEGVAHTRYFNQPKTAIHLLKWLQG